MSDKHNDDGGPAFPAYDDPYVAYGMTLRDYFAGQAIAGFLAASVDTMGAFVNTIEREGLGLTLEQGAARAAYGVADAMLKERQE